MRAGDPIDSRIRLCGIGLFILFGCLVLNGKFNWVDDAYYILLGKALASGEGYKDIHLPVPLTHRFFPPGLPWLLSLPSLIGLDLNTNVLIFKLLLIACGALGLFFFARLAHKEGYSSRTITLAIILSATSIAFVGYTYRVASEMLYVLLSILALISAGRYEQSPRLSRWLAASALFIAAAILTRSIGAVLLGAVLMSWIVRREFSRAGLLLLTTMMLLLPWFWAMGGTGPGVTRYFEDMLLQYRAQNGTEVSLLALSRQVAENSWLIVGHEIPRIILSVSASGFVAARPWLDALLVPVRLGISVVVLLTLLYSLWPKPRIMPAYVACYIGLLMVWPWEPSRYLIPLNPFFCLLFVAGLEALLKRAAALKAWQPQLLVGAKGLTLSNGITLAVALCVASHLISDARFVLTVWQSGDYTPQAAEVWNDTMSAYDWLKGHTPPSSIIGCAPTVEAHVYLFTGRKAVALPAQPAACRELGLTHVIRINDGPINGSGEGRAESDLKLLIKRAGGDTFLAPVYQNANVIVFRVDQARLAALIDQNR